jgi:pseudolysin
MKRILSSSLLGLTALLVANSSFAANAIDLSKQSVTALQAFLPSPTRAAGGLAESVVKETSKNVDFNQTTHIRLAQTYSNYPVWGGESVVHLPKNVTPSLRAAVDPRFAKHVSMNGTVYQNLHHDLANTPAYVFSDAQLSKALTIAKQKFTDEMNAKFSTSEESAKLMVYVDEKQVAHWAIITEFMSSVVRGMPAKPVYILDAVSFEAYQHWNNLKTATEYVPGGGVGGNPNMGKKIYDGLSGNRPALEISRDAATKTCSLQSRTLIVKDRRTNKTPTFKCSKTNSTHNNVYWNTLDDAFNEGYSPNNDALYSDKITREMYQSWMKLEMLEKNGKPWQVTFVVHDPNEGQNAYYNNGKMVFGEGDDESYPVVAPSVVAHEMSHGFTEQHADLVYTRQSGGLNEAFSDMADKAVEYYMYGANNWDVDAELLKPGGRMLRYMDVPSKDCKGRRDGTPGVDCSIDHVKDYRNSTDVHLSSGVYNRAFTLIAAKWNTRKAFEVMTQANVNYWTKNTTFDEAACGVLKATADYKYDAETVVSAFKEVGVKTAQC